MEAQERQLPHEREAAVGSWIAQISENGTVGEIDHGLLKEVLESFGANFEVGEDARKSLGKYTNKGKAEGLVAVWGGNVVADYKEWAKRFVEEFENKESSRPLPKLVLKSDPGSSSGSKTSGMLQFFGELTAFAAGVMSFEDFKKYTEGRALNGHLWQEKKGDERVRIKVPTADEPILLASFPPGFPSRAWSKLKEWRT